MELQLLILGLLYERDLHPYEVLQILKQRQVHEYIKIHYGTLYYAFEQMEKKGWIEVKEVTQEGRRPEKRIYRITSAGRRYFKELLYQAFRSDARMYHPLYPALINGHLADPAVVEPAVREKLEEARKTVELLRRLYEEKVADHPFSVAMLIRNALLHGEAELRWLEEFLAGVQAGRL